MNRLFTFLLAAVLGLTLVAALAGCGSDEGMKEAQAPAEETAAAPAEAPAEAAAPAEEAAPAEAPAEKADFQVGFVYVSPVGDAGWSYSHDQGRQMLEAMDGVTTSFVESVAEGADAERVIRNMARKGFDLIITTSFGYMDPTLKVAQEFPDIAFLHCSGFLVNDNMSNYFGRIYQARYLTGLTAGAMSKSGQIGYVAAMQIPEVIRGINAFTLGVRAANPAAQVRVVWTNTWYDPALEKDAAVSLLDAGCDVIAQHQDSPGPQEAAQERGAYSIGYHTDMAAFAPAAHLTAAVWNWAPYYEKVVDAVRNGTWKGNESHWMGIDEGTVDIAPFGPMVPQEVRDTVNAAKARMLDGEEIVFVGPIKDQSGEVVVPDGEVIPDGDLLSMKWFVEGVVGTID